MSNVIATLGKRCMMLSSILLIVIFTSSLNMVSAAQPFNIEIDLPDSYKDVASGTDVWFTIKLLNLANTQRVDVTLNYAILDSNGESIIHNSKTVAIETQASFVADLMVPDTVQPGDYTINVVVNSSLGESSAKASLRVSTPHVNLLFYYIGGGVVLIVLMIFIIIKSAPLIDKIKLKTKIKNIVREKLKNDKK
jgi:hypothetical protein